VDYLPWVLHGKTYCIVYKKEIASVIINKSYKVSRKKSSNLMVPSYNAYEENK
jgi:hypothetical protein